MKICSVEQCFGCGACSVVCPKNCITMQLDEKGFDRPIVNESQCVNCNLCVKTCQNIRNIQKNTPLVTYACWNVDEKDHKTSSSGGISQALVETVLEEGGVAFGATWDSDLTVCHKGVNDIKKSLAFKKSKYVQSRTLNTYKEVLEALNQGKKVIYTGTPCQIAGLKAVVGENENLFLVDIICHGTPSIQSLNQHIRLIEEKSGKKADGISFRGDGHKLTLTHKGEPFYSKKSVDDIWYIGFLKGLFYKTSCYTCPFATSKRVADLTLGDFWGLNDTDIKREAKHGVSAMLVNTLQGEKLLNKAKDKIVLYEQPTDMAVQGNKQLRFPMPKHRNYEKFYRLNKKYSFDTSAKKCLQKERLKYLIAKLIKRA